MNTNKRSTFSTKLGAILAVAGSAVGLGNIWRFPYEAGENGGAVFLFFYILSVVLICLPVLLAEFYLGRHTQRGVAEAFEIVSKDKKWSGFGGIGLISSLCFLGFYSVVSGWTLEYVWEAITNHLAGKSAIELQQSFELLCSDVSHQYLWTLIFLIITFAILAGGIEKGIERASNILMPPLFILMLLLAFYSFSLPGIKDGIHFLFHPDFEKLNGKVILKAVAQAFFSLSLGMGAHITYSSYFSKQSNLLKTAGMVCLLDTFAALLSGIIIFPAVFSFGVAPMAGPKLVFITLPNIFNQMWGGYFLAIAFFVLLSIAALTSLVSSTEVSITFLCDKFKLHRYVATFIVFIIGLGVAYLCTLSQGESASFRCFGYSIFDLFDKIVSEFMLPIGAILLSYFVGWKMDKRSFLEELSNRGKIRFYGFEFVVFLLKYIIPMVLILIFIHQFC